MSQSTTNDIAHAIIGALIMGNDDYNYSRALAASIHDQGGTKNVLSDDGESELKLRKFTTEDKDQTTCPIMHIPFDIDDDVIELPCGHIFEPEGIKRWLKDEKAECPVCRYKMKSKEIKNEDAGTPSEQDNNEIITGRSNIISNLRRLNTMVVPTPNVRHPFGPSGQRIASIVHEEDDAHDIMQAILSTIRNRTIPQELGTLGSDISRHYDAQFNPQVNPFDNIIVNDYTYASPIERPTIVNNNITDDDTDDSQDNRSLD